MADAARQPGELLLPGVSELGEPRPADDIGARQELFDHRPHGGGAEHQRFLAGPGIEQPVGEDVAAFEIGAQLDLVDRHEGDVEVARHGLDGRDPKARIGRLDLLFAGDEGDGLDPDLVDHLVVDLAGEEPQRQSDHAARMRDHALDGEEGLAGIGRPQHGGDAGAARLLGGVRGRRGCDGDHYASGPAAR